MPNLIATSSAVALGGALRTTARTAAVIGRHAGSLVRLTVDAASTAPSAPTSRNVLRDELLELWRELAMVSWQESRRAIDELDARTRPAPAGADGPRRHRVKP